MIFVVVRVFGLTVLEAEIFGLEPEPEQLAAEDDAPAVVNDVNLITFGDDDPAQDRR